MAVLRQFNALGQERLDVPHIRAIESAICADFDLLVGLAMCGARSYVVQGFKFAIPGAVGAAASALQVVVADSILFHYNASESGSIFNVPADRLVEKLSPTNARVIGGFTANTTNYVGVDVRRSADDTTSDTAQFLDADTLKEAPKTVPLGRTLDYVFIVSTTDFTTTPSVAALAKVVTDTSNNVVSIEDARESMFRLGRGGSVPNNSYAYPWSEGRIENTSGEVFTGGDKAITSLKDWMDAMMTRTWEVGGGERWYSSVADRNVKMVRSSTATFGNGEYFEWDGSNLHWKSLRFVFPNSTGSYNDLANQIVNSAGQTDLADGDCLYVDLDFTTNRTGGTALVAVKAALATLGSPTTPGTRYVMAWRVGSAVFTRDTYFAVGASSTAATMAASGTAKLSRSATNATSPIVVSETGSWLKNPNKTAGSNGFSAVVQTGAGAGVVSASGVCGGDYVYIIEILLGGNVATATFRYSSNGGRTYSGTITTATTVTDSTTGVVIGFNSGAGPFVAGDTYTFEPLYAPMEVVRDRYGFIQNGIDHGGSRMCRVSRLLDECWVRNPTGVTDGIWATGNGATGQAAWDVPGITSPAYPEPVIGLTCSQTGSTNNFGAVWTRTSISALMTRMRLTIEFEAMVGTHTDHCDFIAGLISNHSSQQINIDSSHGGIYFRRKGASNGGRWLAGAATHMAGVTEVDTGVASVADWQLFKIEFVGADYNDLGSGAPVVRYWINGILVATITTHIPIVGTASPQLGFIAINQVGVSGPPATSRTAYIGHVGIEYRRFNVNHVL